MDPKEYYGRMRGIYERATALTDEERAKISLENLFAFAAYVSVKHPEKHSVAVISASIPDGMLMEFQFYNWLREGEGLRLDLTSDLAKTILAEHLQIKDI